MWVSWIQWISIYKWGYEALCINEYTGLVLHCDPGEYINVAPGVQVCPITTGEQELQRLNFSSAYLWIPLVVMASMLVVMRFLAVVFLVLQMRRLKKKMQ